MLRFRQRHDHDGWADQTRCVGCDGLAPELLTTAQGGCWTVTMVRGTVTVTGSDRLCGRPCGVAANATSHDTALAMTGDRGAIDCVHCHVTITLWNNLKPESKSSARVLRPGRSSQLDLPVRPRPGPGARLRDTAGMSIRDHMPIASSHSLAAT
jgi:hypothetical protein